MKVTDVSKEFQGTLTERRTRTSFIVVHHAAALYPTHTGIEDARAVKDYHVRTRGWGGIGYHEAIAESTPGGELEAFILSDPFSQRAHIWMRNHECFGIVALTNFGKTIPADKWIQGLAERVRVARQKWPLAQVVGHKEIALPGSPTSCPGDAWSVWKPDLLERSDPRQTQLTPGYYRIISGIDFAAVREAPRLNSPVAMGGLARLTPGKIVHIDGTEGGFAHLSTKNDFGDLGFVHVSLLGPVEFPKEVISLEPLPIDYPIVGAPQVPPQVLDRAMIRYAPSVGQWERDIIVAAYTTCGELLGLGNLLPFAQAAHETAWFTSEEWRERRNPAGLGKTSDEVKGVHFWGVSEGILAQYAHLLNYAHETPPSAPHQEAVLSLDPRYEIMAKNKLFGTAKTWSQLTGKWATDPAYAPKIFNWVDKIRNA